jgi:MFS transporter, SP family, sugar:H+ symporter
MPSLFHQIKVSASLTSCARSTPYMVDAKGANLQSKVFFVWGSFCLLAIVFVWSLIYETKGLTLEQVDELYELVSQAWKSKEFRPKVNFREAQEHERGMSLRQMSVAQERRRSSAGVHSTGEKVKGSDY